MKKLLSFVVICLWVLGTIGGIGYAIYGGSYPVAAGVAMLAILAWPTVKKHFDYLKS